MRTVTPEFHGDHAMVIPSDITWIVRPRASRDIAPFRKMMGEESYELDKQALQIWLCDYFNGGPCISSRGQISPIGSTSDDGKALKARWAYPGSGKSGGLRLAIAAYCNERRVEVAACWMRKEEPSDMEFGEALDG
jgi:hypothetical protein